jgi:hypothetical protein
MAEAPLSEAENLFRQTGPALCSGGEELRIKYSAGAAMFPQQRTAEQNPCRGDGAKWLCPASSKGTPALPGVAKIECAPLIG